MSRRRCCRTSSLVDLPTELLERVVNCIDAERDLFAFQASCRTVRAICSHPSVVAAWLATHRRRTALVRALLAIEREEDTRGVVDVLDALVHVHGLDVNEAQCDSGITPLMSSVRIPSSSADPSPRRQRRRRPRVDAGLSYLLRSPGIRVNQETHVGSGITALTRAVMLKNVGAMRALLAHSNIDPNQVTRTALTHVQQMLLNQTLINRSSSRQTCRCSGTPARRGTRRPSRSC